MFSIGQSRYLSSFYHFELSYSLEILLSKFSDSLKELINTEAGGSGHTHRLQ